jgi:hypothetical protein
MVIAITGKLPKNDEEYLKLLNAVKMMLKTIWGDELGEIH